MGFQESQIAVLLASAIASFAAKYNLGVVTGEGGMILFPGNQVRIPDVAFISWARFPGGEIPDDPAPEIVPDLAIEVLSRSNSSGEMSRKLREYFKAGVRLVWYVDPVAKSVTVYTSPSRHKTVPLEGVLDGGVVLPGFSLPVRDLFVVSQTRPTKNGNKRKR